MSAAGVQGLGALHHWLLDRVEMMLLKKLRPLSNHPAGPRTVFFWAPMMKWSLTCAGLADIARPAEKLSPALHCSDGYRIWPRYL